LRSGPARGKVANAGTSGDDGTGSDASVRVESAQVDENQTLTNIDEKLIIKKTFFYGAAELLCVCGGLAQWTTDCKQRSCSADAHGRTVALACIAGLRLVVGVDAGVVVCGCALGALVKEDQPKGVCARLGAARKVEKVVVRGTDGDDIARRGNGRARVRVDGGFGPVGNVICRKLGVRVAGSDHQQCSCSNGQQRERGRFHFLLPSPN